MIAFLLMAELNFILFVNDIFFYWLILFVELIVGGVGILLDFFLLVLSRDIDYRRYVSFLKTPSPRDATHRAFRYLSQYVKYHFFFFSIMLLMRVSSTVRRYEGWSIALVLKLSGISNSGLDALCGWGIAIHSRRFRALRQEQLEAHRNRLG